MIDPSFVDITDTVVIGGVSFSGSSVTLVLKEQVAYLEKQLEVTKSNQEFNANRLRHRDAQVEQLGDWLKENFNYIDSDHANTLVEMFDLSITQDYEVTITARFSGIVSVPVAYDIDELENDLSISLDTHHYGNSDVVFDVSEDGVDIVSTEA